MQQRHEGESATICSTSATPVDEFCKQAEQPQLSQPDSRVEVLQPSEHLPGSSSTLDEQRNILIPKADLTISPGA
ncbi:hypothetical protein BTVI_87021 [Pitangus sulphuratus]|nr:hypothetical protein BTVI_87021 [Pitangus sulphuratus]